MKLVKRMISVVLLVSLIIGLIGCTSKSPSSAVETYLEQIKKGDSEELTKLLSQSLSEESASTDLDSYESSDELFNTMKGITYTVNSEKVNGDSATVNVTLNGPDLAAVLVETIGKAFSNSFTLALSGNEPPQEEMDKLFDNMLLESLKSVKNTERTGDISLSKIENEWKINNDDSLIILLTNIDQSMFDFAEENEENKNTEIKEMELNQPFNVETEKGNYILTIDGVRTTDERNEFSEVEAKKVVFLDFTYENTSFQGDSGEDLYIDSYAFQVLDDEGNVLGDYPVQDENRVSRDVPIGGKCKASVTFAVPTDSENLNVTFTRGTEKVAKIIVPIK